MSWVLSPSTSFLNSKKRWDCRHLKQMRQKQMGIKNIVDDQKEYVQLFGVWDLVTLNRKAVLEDFHSLFWVRHFDILNAQSLQTAQSSAPFAPARGSWGVPFFFDLVNSWLVSVIRTIDLKVHTEFPLCKTIVLWCFISICDVAAYGEETNLALAFFFFRCGIHCCVEVLPRVVKCRCGYRCGAHGCIGWCLDDI